MHDYATCKLVVVVRCTQVSSSFAIDARLRHHSPHQEDVPTIRVTTTAAETTPTTMGLVVAEDPSLMAADKASNSADVGAEDGASEGVFTSCVGENVSNRPEGENVVAGPLVGEIVGVATLAVSTETATASALPMFPVPAQSPSVSPTRTILPLPSATIARHMSASLVPPFRIGASQQKVRNGRCQGIYLYATHEALIISCQFCCRHVQAATPLRRRFGSCSVCGTRELPGDVVG